MRCRPCGAPRNPSVNQCDYCQSYHESVENVGLAAEYDPRVSAYQAQMMVAQRQGNHSYLGGMFMGLGHPANALNSSHGNPAGSVLRPGAMSK